MEKYVVSGLIMSDISDHFPNFVISNENFPRDTDEAPISIVFRDKSEKNKTKFRNCLSNISWFDLVNFYDPKEAYSSFLK